VSNGDFFDSGDTKGAHQIEPKYRPEDFHDVVVLCDLCGGNIRLEPFQGGKLVCPRCLSVTDPTFDYVKHDIVETTIEEDRDNDNRQMGFINDDPKLRDKTKIRKKMEEDAELPDHVKQELDFIQWRPGYKTVPLDRKKFNSDNTREK